MNANHCSFDEFALPGPVRPASRRHGLLFWGRQQPAWVIAGMVCVLVLRPWLANRFVIWFPAAATSHFGELCTFVWWAGTSVVGFVAIPMLVLRGTRRWPGAVSLRDCHLRFDRHNAHGYVYGLLWVANASVVVVAARTDQFQSTYPLYSQLTRSGVDLLGFYAVYAVQFSAVEFCFRGYLLATLRPLFGRWTVLAVCGPYVLIHIGKPPAEIVASVFAGLILGTIATRTTSIWGGVMLHIAVAATMDIAVLAWR